MGVVHVSVNGGPHPPVRTSLDHTLQKRRVRWLDGGSGWGVGVATPQQGGGCSVIFPMFGSLNSSLRNPKHHSQPKVVRKTPLDFHHVPPSFQQKKKLQKSTRASASYLAIGYSSSQKHGSGKWVPPILVSFHFG